MSTLWTQCRGFLELSGSVVHELSVFSVDDGGRLPPSTAHLADGSGGLFQGLSDHLPLTSWPAYVAHGIQCGCIVTLMAILRQFGGKRGTR